jgi:XTP/dITP diphosphohydrolase
MQRKIIFATNNPHKLKEIQHLLGNHFSLMSLQEIGFTGDIPEDKPTLEGNALEKANYIFERYNLPCFADDTGLEIDALQGEPGVYSARYAGELEIFGSEDKRSEANIVKVLTKLKNVSGRKARFRTVIAYIDSNQEHFFEGTMEGTITYEKRGKSGFGYDPIFIPDGSQLTFAEMPLIEKNKISHRARAFAKFVEYMTDSKNQLGTK